MYQRSLDRKGRHSKLSKPEREAKTNSKPSPLETMSVPLGGVGINGYQYLLLVLVERELNFFFSSR